MKLAFYLIAAVMITAAVALLLLPLVRHGRQLGRPRGVFALALAIAMVLPLGAAGLYLLIGTPMALNGVAAESAAPLDMDQALAQLRAHLTQQPDDLQGWMLLAQTMGATRQPIAARDAYDHALVLAPNNTAALVGWAEADSQSRSDHRITGRARDLLDHAVLLEPENQRGLWLLGISQFQQDRYDDAAATWRRLQPLLQSGSTVAQAVTEQIAVADARNGAHHAASSVASTAARLTVQVSVAPALRKHLGQGATLFVYARAGEGPAMPLAVARRDAATLPVTVTLTDAMAMTPQHNLSSAKRVFVGARISRSGQATAESGDLEGDAGVVAVDRARPVIIRINRVHR